MEARKILTKHLSRLFKEDMTRRDEISSRMESLPDRDAGLAFWEDFCRENDWLPKPTNANIKRYIQEFVDVQNDKLHKTYRRLRLSKSDKGYRTSYVLFLEPVWRLHTKESSNLSAAEVPVMEASVPSAPSTALNAHHDIVDISQVLASVVNISTNLNENTNDNKRSKDKSKDNKKRSRNELESDGEHSAEGSTQISLAVLVPSKAVRSSCGKITSPPIRAVSHHCLETILQPTQTHGTTTNSAPHSAPEASGSLGTMVMTATGRSDKSPVFKAQEFDNGLCRWSQFEDPPEGRYGLHDVKSVPKVLEEWRYGIPRSSQEDTSIQGLNSRFSATWRSVADKTRYQARLAVVTEYIRLVLVEGCSDTKAIEILETKRRGRAIVTLAKDLHKEAALRAEDTIYGKDEPEYPRHLIHLPEHVPRPPRTELTGFPLPVRRIHSIDNIWDEWVKGWEGQPSIESLIADMHRRKVNIWDHKDYQDYENHFRYRNQLVRTIQEAKRKRVVQSHQDAIRVLEDQRGAQEPSTLCKSQAFRRFLREEWKITTKVDEWWEYGPKKKPRK